ncbi:sugar transferase [Tetragenococcus halophilus]|uniref:sugar transferase n=1 Tax=Tetragenococcus halophilus TaxID=51669 RepID=UPI001BB3E1B3|nr:sugar transferase [Tetragenococcus halophilus]
MGPRPIIPEELEEYKRENRVLEFLSMKPGITGIWAVSGRSYINYPERVYLEIKYKDNCSIFYDLKIIFKTFFKTLKKEGAY